MRGRESPVLSIQRHLKFLLVIVIFVLAASLMGAEVLVRVTRGMPQQEKALDENLPLFHEPDPELGWRNKAGTFVWPGQEGDAGRDIVMTFWPDSLRATARERKHEPRQAIVLGCSYTQGWAVTNEETYPWMLHDTFPSLEFLNYGTAGFGTLQSLLSLERHYSRSTVPSEIIIYGFVDHHETRNVAPAFWLRRLVTVSRAGRLTVPFATIGADGSLERHPPEGYPKWPFDRLLASVAFLEDRYADFRTARRAAQGRAVTEALLIEMQRVSLEHGAHLVVVLLSSLTPGTMEHYLGFLKAQKITTFDCSAHPTGLPFLVPGYGHPNRAVHAHWAGCIARGLNELGY